VFIRDITHIGKKNNPHYDSQKGKAAKKASWLLVSEIQGFLKSYDKSETTSGMQFVATRFISSLR
jgi:hypothetical protein